MTPVDLYFSEPQEWSEAEFREAHLRLSEAERFRASRFRFDRDRRLYVVAHTLLRRALGERLSIHPQHLQFETNEHGRPELGHPRARALRFSLSHSHGMAACAVTPDRDIGFDVEPLNRELPMGVAERIFAPFELQDLLLQPPELRQARFLAYWTLKEAYVKARGLGLSLPVQNVAFVLSTNAPEFRPDPGIESNASDWIFESFRLGKDHQAALALRGAAPFSRTTHRICGLDS